MNLASDLHCNRELACLMDAMKNLGLIFNFVCVRVRKEGCLSYSSIC